MDYEEKYKAALERARQFGEHSLQGDSANIVECIFPELQGNNDERIRKAIISGMIALKNNQNIKTFAAIPINDCWPI